MQGPAKASNQGGSLSTASATQLQLLLAATNLDMIRDRDKHYLASSGLLLLPLEPQG